VLVPSGEAGFVYVTASVSIDYSDARAATEINSHLALYRDIVFEAMGRALASEKIDKVTEADLLDKIKEALNRSLPGRYVEQVQFKVFSTG
jgi:flagellar basal body-associated protein FliL